MLANLRKAYVSRGDDPRTRWVKEPGRHMSGRKTAPMPADATGTRFTSRVIPPDRHILTSGHNTVKIGKTVRKGKLRGYYIYYLSLQERKTCPRTCAHWETCYGNAMPLAKRVDHTHPDFLHVLEAAVDRLCKWAARPHTLPKGILIRLHELGDFYSPGYVAFWWKMLEKHPMLSLYGYTAHKPGKPAPGFAGDIGACVADMNAQFPNRSMIRFSNGGLGRMDTLPIKDEQSCPPTAFICPEQTGKTLGCDTCGACWGTAKTVAFLEH